MGISLIVMVLCLLATQVNPSSEKVSLDVVTPVPEGVKWLVTTVSWVGSVGLLAAVVVRALVSRRTEVIRDTFLAGASAGRLRGPRRPVRSRRGTVAGDGAPRLRPVVPGGEGRRRGGRGRRGTALPHPMGAADRHRDRRPPGPGHDRVRLRAPGSRPGQPGGGCPVHGGRPSLLRVPPGTRLGRGDPGAAGRPRHRRRRGDAGHEADLGARAVQRPARRHFLDISFYGRDAADAQLLSKVTRFLLYRDSGPTLTYTRRQQVEHEATSR